MTLWWVGPFFCQQIVTMWARSWAQPTVKHKNFIQRSAAFYDFKRFRMRSEGPGREGSEGNGLMMTGKPEFLDQMTNNMTCWVIFFILYDIYILPIWHIWDFLKLQSSDADFLYCVAEIFHYFSFIYPEYYSNSHLSSCRYLRGDKNILFSANFSSPGLNVVKVIKTILIINYKYRSNF